MKRKKIVTIILSIVFIGLFSIIFLKIGRTYSKYIENIKVQGVTKIAKPYLSLENNNILEVENLNTDIITYEFSVQNFDDEKFSETSFLYNIYFTFSQEQAPLKLILCRILENEEKYIELSENNSTLIPEKLELQEEKAKYKLEVYYDLESSKEMLNNLEVNINVEAYQEKGENV